jgi:hypothetical protein
MIGHGLTLGLENSSAKNPGVHLFYPIFTMKVVIVLSTL